jgi:hypothetical protein
LKYCNSFERKFYNSLKQGQINAIKNGADIFDFSTITNFEWDSVTLIRGNESVPVFSEEIEEIFNNELSIIVKTSDLQINKHRFYFLTPKKKIIEKEIKGGHELKPMFRILSCLIDSTNLRDWLSKEECRFILKSDVSIIGEGTIYLFPNCKTMCSPNSIKMHD